MLKYKRSLCSTLLLMLVATCTSHGSMTESNQSDQEDDFTAEWYDHALLALPDLSDHTLMQHANSMAAHNAVNNHDYAMLSHACIFDLASLDTLDSAGNKPIHKAVALNDQRIVSRLLMEDIVINFPNAAGVTPLLYAAYNNNHAIAIDLLDYGNAYPTAQNFLGQMALHRFAYHGNTVAVQALCQAYRKIAPAYVAILLDEPDAQGWTALHYAAAMGHGDLVDMLISDGAHADKPDHAGKTPLWLAVNAGHESTVRALIGAGAQVFKDFGSNVHPLACAEQKGYNVIADMLYQALVVGSA